MFSFDAWMNNHLQWYQSMMENPTLTIMPSYRYQTTTTISTTTNNTQTHANVFYSLGACIYLSSKAGSYVTGVILNVDGGSVGGLKIDLTSNLWRNNKVAKKNSNPNANRNGNRSY